MADDQQPISKASSETPEASVAETSIDSVSHLLEIVKQYGTVGGFGWYFRGQARIGWTLEPRAFRDPYYGPGVGLHADLVRFDLWKREAMAYDHDMPKDDLELMAVAQHHGFATRLLDWTGNPLVALFNTCIEYPDEDGAFFAFHPEGFFKDRDLLGPNDLRELKEKFDKIPEALGYLPPAISRRILVQRGYFTVHRKPDKPFDGVKNKPIKYKVPKQLKKKFLVDLNLMGINHAVLYPDLDGYCRYQNWLASHQLKYVAKSADGSRRHVHSTHEPPPARISSPPPSA